MRKLRVFSVIFVCLCAALVLASCKEESASCDHVWDWLETITPTAMEAGEETYTCLLCGQTGVKRAKSAAQTAITSVNISITAPVNGATPSTTASTADTAYTLGAVTWSPADSEFHGGTAYTASVTLTADSGYTFSGLTSATVNGQGVTLSNKTGSAVTLSYIFPATDTKKVTGMAIKTQPAKLTYTHGDSLDLTGLVVTLTHDDTTTEDVSAVNFASKNITANPAQGDNLVLSAHNGKPVTITYGNLTPRSTNNLTVNPKIIANVEISVTAPVKSSTPDVTANGTGDFTIGAVAWSPSGSLFLGGTVYTVSFTLTANSGYTFTGMNSATINGQNATRSNNNGSAVTLSYTFPETSTKTVTGMAIKTQPAKLTYTHGDSLDLTGLVVTMTHDDTTTEDVPAVNFASKNITANPSNSDNLVRLTHNGQPVTITYGELTQSTNNLTVNRAPGNFGTPVAINTTYTPTLTLASINSQLQNGYAWNAPTTTLNAGNNQSFAATFTDPSGNYNSANGSITVNVAKAQGNFGTPAAINTTYTPTLTLASINSQLPAGYAWNAPTTTLNAGNSQPFAATFTDPSGNYNSASGSITVNVAKATGSFGSPAAVNVTYTSGLTLGNITLPTGYAWNAPNTTLNAGNNQSFAATFTDPSGNYNSANGSITVNVAKATGAAVSAPTALASGIFLDNVTLYSYIAGQTTSTGQSFEYAINSTNTAPSSGWQDSRTFSGLTAETTYYFFARSKENDNYNTGTASASLTVTTAKPIEMVRVEGGSFQMGNPDDSISASANERPVHTVTLGQYRAVMGSNQQVVGGYGAGGNYPAVNVNWYDALVFCNKLSMAEGLTPAYRINNSTDPASWGSVPTLNRNTTWDAVEVVGGSTGYRLPTEAQWEYAAKGGNGSPGNYTYSGSNNADDVAWYRDNSSYIAHEVGTKVPNGLGLYDMSGNVWEWCWDRYGAYSSGSQTDPQGASSGVNRVIRGGSYFGEPLSARSVKRNNEGLPSIRISHCGLRLVRP